MNMSPQISTLAPPLTVAVAIPLTLAYAPEALTLLDSPTVINNAYAMNLYGFTLVELIVTVLVIAIIATFAVPAIMTQLARMEAKRVRYELINTLTEAKSESFVRRQDLLLCLSDANGRCHKDSTESVLLFIDNNANYHFDDATDILLAKQRLHPKYGTVHLRAGNRHYIKFWGDSGQPRGFFGHIKYCPTSIYNTAMYQVSFSQIGRIKYKPNESHPTDCL